MFGEAWSPMSVPDLAPDDDDDDELKYMTSEAAVIIAVVLLLSLFVTVAVVSLADFDLYKAF